MYVALLYTLETLSRGGLASFGNSICVVTNVRIGRLKVSKVKASEQFTSMKMPDPKEEWRYKFHCGVNACIKTSTCQTSIGLQLCYGCLGVCSVNHRHSPHMAFLPQQPSISRLQSIYFLYISCVAAVVIQDGRTEDRVGKMLAGMPKY